MHVTSAKQRCDVVGVGVGVGVVSVVMEGAARQTRKLQFQQSPPHHIMRTSGARTNNSGLLYQSVDRRWVREGIVLEEHSRAKVVCSH
jgi:hypothetical protein